MIIRLCDETSCDVRMDPAFVGFRLERETGNYRCEGATNTSVLGVLQFCCLGCVAKYANRACGVDSNSAPILRK